MYTENEIYDFVKENDIKFIRLSFVDMFGKMKNVSIMPNELPRAFHEGVTFDASSVDGFSDEADSDAFLTPIASTLYLMPWRPSHGRVVRMFCSIRRIGEKPSAFDTRAFLSEAVFMAKQAGITFHFGAECEFYLFRRDDAGNPSKIPFDHGAYMDTAPLDKGENIRREICLTLDEMGIAVESSHHENGPGQNEIDFKYSDPETSADNVVTLKDVIENISFQNGLYASFSPKPLEDQSGNGFHINISLQKNGKYDNEITDYFMAGVLAHISEITAFLNPSEESYKRFGTGKAPYYITWAPHNRSSLIRIPEQRGGIRRIELRSPDCCTNPYLAYALIIYAGMDGIQNKTALPKPTEINLFDIKKSQDIPSLPKSFFEAMQIASDSAFVQSIVPDNIIQSYKNKAGI